MENSKVHHQPSKEGQDKKDIASKSPKPVQTFTPPPSGLPTIPSQKNNQTEKIETENSESFSSEIIQQMKTFVPADGIPNIPPVQKKSGEEIPQPIASENSLKLPDEVQAKMEQAFNANFSNVQMYEGSNALNIGALAYTQGNQIHFAPGQFQPYTQKGQELLGHELTHVLQQRDGKVQPTTQRKGININDSETLEKEADDMGKKAAKGELNVSLGGSGFHSSNTTQMKTVQMKPGDGDDKKGTSFLYRVYVKQTMNSDELLLLFVQQYYKVDPATAIKLRDENGWQWASKPREVTQEEVSNGYIDLHVTDYGLKPLSDNEKKESQKQFEGLTGEEKDAINKEADKQFWEKTHYKEGQKLNPSNSSDKLQAEYWKRIRAKLLDQKASLDNLPLAVKEFLRSPDTFKPENYDRLLSIADLLGQFDTADFNDYKSKVNSETTDLAELERSLLHYLEEKQKRKEATEAKEKVATKLYGLEELYKQYRLYKLISTTSSSMVMNPYSPGIGNTMASMKLLEELEVNAKKNGFAGLADFEASIKAYEEAFKKETIAIGMDALAKYEHILFEEEKKYKDLSIVQQLQKQISPQGADADSV